MDMTRRRALLALVCLALALLAIQAGASAAVDSASAAPARGLTVRALDGGAVIAAHGPNVAARASAKLTVANVDGLSQRFSLGATTTGTSTTGTTALATSLRLVIVRTTDGTKLYDGPLAAFRTLSSERSRRVRRRRCTSRSSAPKRQTLAARCARASRSRSPRSKRLAESLRNPLQRSRSRECRALAASTPTR